MSQVSIIDIEGNHPQIPTEFIANQGSAIPIANQLEIFGDTVAPGILPVYTSASGNNVTLNVQISQAIAASNPLNVGLSAFNSAQFTVDADGFVSLSGGGTGAVLSVATDSAGPIFPNGSGQISILGEAVSASSTPVQTDGSVANTVTIQIQRASSSASTSAANAGLASFNSSHFLVDSNGFVGLVGGGTAIDEIAVDASTVPGTNPVTPNAAGLITVTGAQVATGTIGANVIRTNSTAVNSYIIEIQRSTAVAATDSTKNGVSHFDSNQFTVDANGFVSLIGGSLAVDSFAMQTGTSPVVPAGTGLVTFNGSSVAAGTNPVRTNGTGANTMQLEVQTSQAIAAADATKIGLSNYDSTSFAVTATGFVTLVGGGFTWSDVSGAFSPLKNNGYFVTGTATATLPASPSQGDTIKFFVDHASQVLTIDAPGTQLIRMGTLVSSAGGTATSTQQGDSVELVYRASNTCWEAVCGFSGTWTMA